MEKKMQLQVKHYLMENFTCDHIVVRKNGTVEVKRSYFYRMGQTAEGLAEKVAECLKVGGFDVKVTGRDDYANWPQTSYFVAVIEDGGQE